MKQKILCKAFDVRTPLLAAMDGSSINSIKFTALDIRVERECELVSERDGTYIKRYLKVTGPKSITAILYYPKKFDAVCAQILESGLILEISVLGESWHCMGKLMNCAVCSTGNGTISMVAQTFANLDKLPDFSGTYVQRAEISFVLEDPTLKEKERRRRD